MPQGEPEALGGYVDKGAKGRNEGGSFLPSRRAERASLGRRPGRGRAKPALGHYQPGGADTIAGLLSPLVRIRADRRRHPTPKLAGEMGQQHGVFGFRYGLHKGGESKGWPSPVPGKSKAMGPSDRTSVCDRMMIGTNLPVLICFLSFV